jgi:hypothetical protein
MDQTALPVYGTAEALLAADCENTEFTGFHNRLFDDEDTEFTGFHNRLLDD